MLELKVRAGRRLVPLHDLPMRLGRMEAAREIGDTVEGLIQFLDEISGDPDLEDNDDREADTSDYEPDDDAQGDTSWTEWHTRGRHKDNPGVTTKDGRQLHEDYEDDDSDHGLDEGEPNYIAVSDGGAGCPIAGDLEANGDETDYSDDGAI